MPSSHAVVEIERPERYAKQLAAHLGHRSQVTSRTGGFDIVFASGTGRLDVGTDALEMTAVADDVESLERVRSVLERHLLQFTTRLPQVTVTWTDAP